MTKQSELFINALEVENLKLSNGFPNPICIIIFIWVDIEIISGNVVESLFLCLLIN